jgi:hypothetical protein
MDSLAGSSDSNVTHDTRGVTVLEGKPKREDDSNENVKGQTRNPLRHNRAPATGAGSETYAYYGVSIELPIAKVRSIEDIFTRFNKHPGAERSLHPEVVC